MKKIIREISTGETVGTLITNQKLTDEEIFELAGVEIMITEDDFAQGEKYDMNDLEIINK